MRFMPNARACKPDSRRRLPGTKREVIDFDGERGVAFMSGNAFESVVAAAAIHG